MTCSIGPVVSGSLKLVSIGFSMPACMERIFDAYYTTKGGGHMSLGLRIACATAEKHDGELVYDPARGFILRIPTTNHHAEMA